MKVKLGLNMEPNLHTFKQISLQIWEALFAGDQSQLLTSSVFLFVLLSQALPEPELMGLLTTRITVNI